MIKTNLKNYVAIVLLTSMLIFMATNFNGICDAITKLLQL